MVRKSETLSPWQRRDTRGFTLVELLVVIAIIGILIALLLPAVQSAREAARRAQCSNNLKQIGLAVHNYHTSFGCFPPGSIDCPNYPTDCSGAYTGGGPYLTTWTICLLPFLEQQTLYDQYDSSLPSSRDNINKRVTQTFIPAYLCPSDVNTDQLARPESGPSAYDYAPGSYRAVSGLKENASGAAWDEANSQDRDTRGVMHGLFNTGSRTVRWANKIANVTDGTANTLMVAEYHTTTHNRRRTFWAYAYTSYNQSSACPGCNPWMLGVPDYDECVKQSSSFEFQTGENACKRAFASLHPGGFNGVRADGSVYFISTTIDRNIFGAMASIAGGEIVNLAE